MKTFPRSIAVPTALMMALIGLSGAWLAVMSMTSSPRVLASAGFEAVIAVIGVSGVLFALGSAGRGRATGLLNLGGVLVVAAITARFAWHTTLNQEALGVRAAVRAAVTDPWFFVRGGIGMGLVAWSVVTALGAEAVAWRRLVIGTLLSLPFILGAAGVLLRGTEWLLPSMTDAVTTLRLVGGVLATLIAAVLFAVGVHLVIKAFELARGGQRVPGMAGSA